MNLSVHIAFAGGQEGRGKACGIVIIDTDTSQRVREIGFLVERGLSAEVAHYDALHRAIEAVVDAGACDVVFHCPTQQFIDQIIGAAPVHGVAVEQRLERVQAALLKLDLWRLSPADTAGLDHARQLAGQTLDQAGS